MRDVAAANAVALEALTGADAAGGPAGFAAYNVGSGDPRTVGDMAEALAAACGGPAPVVTGEYRLGDVRHITADSARLRHDLGWRPAIPFTTGMAELAAAADAPSPAWAADRVRKGTA
ncbi:NAD-dependent dehydratase [Streptomyces avidinii]